MESAHPPSSPVDTPTTAAQLVWHLPKTKEGVLWREKLLNGGHSSWSMFDCSAVRLVLKEKVEIVCWVLSDKIVSPEVVPPKPNLSIRIPRYVEDDEDDDYSDDGGHYTDGGGYVDGQGGYYPVDGGYQTPDGTFHTPNGTVHPPDHGDDGGDDGGGGDEGGGGSDVQLPA